NDTSRMTPVSSLFPYTTLFRSVLIAVLCVTGTLITVQMRGPQQVYWAYPTLMTCFYLLRTREATVLTMTMASVLFVQLVGEVDRSEEHTSELQSRENLVCRLLL